MRLAEQWCEEEMKASGRDNRTLVVGLGLTGLSVARFLSSRGADVVVIDSRVRPPGLAELRRFGPELPVILESLDSRWLDGVSQVVLSPGLGLDTPIAVEAQRRGIPLVSDIELFAQTVSAPVIGVTGSNGKSTVVTLVEQMLSAGGLRVAAGGNLGPPALELLDENVDAYVLELSSFQLETTESLKPVAAAVLNVSPDHLDRHGSLERYAALKAKLLRSAQFAVFNRDDERVREMAIGHPGGIPFSVREPLQRGFSCMESEGERWLCQDGVPTLPVAALRVRGLHNEANALAAMGLCSVLARQLSVPSLDPQLAALRKFPGLPHRCQWVAEEAGIVFINDSKGTNVGATLAALEGFSGRLVLIAGGQGKGADFRPLVEAAQGKLAGAVLMGEAAEELQAAFAPLAPTRHAGNMAEAVACAVELARAAHAREITVLLSPACASLDMFANYQERGEAFIGAVTGRDR